jgi:RimJ/RimL family protein N-acetyltransferase
MEKYPKEVQLKSGETIVLNPLQSDEMEKLIGFFQSLPIEEKMYLRSDVSHRENIIKRFGTLNYNIRYPLLATFEEKIIAIGSMYRAEFGWTRNLGEIRVVVSPSFQRKGLCTILVKELFFHANQSSAITAFEHMGFKKEAVLHKHVSDIKGERHNLVIMSLDIKELWYLMEDFIQDKMYVT